ncbi:hypothetical protein OG407_49985 [Streptomyces sp. NBC_01515]|uniref:hypothetical protein n=1 Tax=Streptomyces sp. NBC_01515 TaxID=2903890 RepID=UPI00386B71BA
MHGAGWEHAIFTGYTAWRQLREQDAGIVHLDLDRCLLTVDPRWLKAPAEDTHCASSTEVLKRYTPVLHRQGGESPPAPLSMRTPVTGWHCLSQ